MKRQKVIKRIYEKGLELTVVSRKRRKPKKPELVVNKKQGAGKALLSSQTIERTRLVDDHHLPVSYGKDRLRLLVKDPFWVFAYWEIASDPRQSLAKTIGSSEAENSKLTLRMYEVSLVDFNGKNANSYFDIEVDAASNWYVNLKSSNASYTAEIGLKSSRGEFFPLARSNNVRTPASGYSQRSEQIWMHVEDNAKDQPFIRAQERARGEKEKPKPKRRIYLTEEDVYRYYSKLNPALRDVLAKRIQGLFSRKRPFILEGETELERDFIIRNMPEGFFRRVMIGGSERLVIEGQGHEFPGGASEFASKPFSKERKFFFEINAELIVYARTESNALVTVNGKEVKLRPDGTFSLRLSLPDGQFPFDFKAVSADKKETRQISTKVNRQTSPEVKEVEDA